LWPEAAVTASDNDAEAVRVAGHHAAINGAAHIEAMVSEGFADARLRGVYDLVIANILAGPLMEMAADIAAAGQVIVLSGIMNEQADRVIAAYAAQGARLTARGSIGDWTTLVLEAPSD
jgi:ribosomal protein L11 methyltransferase